MTIKKLIRNEIRRRVGEIREIEKRKYAPEYRIIKRNELANLWRTRYTINLE